jgi:hypothetical protein
MRSFYRGGENAMYSLYYLFFDMCILYSAPPRRFLIPKRALLFAKSAVFRFLAFLFISFLFTFMRAAATGSETA